MGKIAFIFPGQGSQKVGMGQSLAQVNNEVMSYFDRANDKLKFDLKSIIFNGPNDELRKTEIAQPALVTTSIALLNYFLKSGIKADYVAGHSLGEYTALIAANSLSFEDGLYVVRNRGLLMEEAVPEGEGAMAAVMGLNREQLQKITKAVTEAGQLVNLANINCPGQIVISGRKQAIEITAEEAKKAGARRVIPLQVSGPFHSHLMKQAASKFTNILDEIRINDAQVQIICNVTARPLTNSAQIKENLLKQLYSPVLWEDSVKYMLSKGVNTFIEIGNGKVLSGLVKKIDPSVKIFSVEDEESCQRTVKAIRGE